MSRNIGVMRVPVLAFRVLYTVNECSIDTTYEITSKKNSYLNKNVNLYVSKMSLTLVGISKTESVANSSYT